MKALLAATAGLISASANGAQAQPDHAASEASVAAAQGDEIVVEAPPLAEELKDTTLTLVRDRGTRATFRIRPTARLSAR
jgi:hypothetical protein